MLAQRAFLAKPLTHPHTVRFKKLTSSLARLAGLRLFFYSGGGRWDREPWAVGSDSGWGGLEIWSDPSITN